MQLKEIRDEAIEAIKEPLYRRVRQRLEKNQFIRFVNQPQKRKKLLHRLSPQTLAIFVQQMPPLSEPGVPMITIGVPETKQGKQDGIHIQILSDEEKDAVWGDVSPTDFKLLCEESVQRSIELYEARLRDTPKAKLDSDYNGAHTYRSLYEMQLAWARESLAWVQRQDEKTIKENIEYF